MFDQFDDFSSESSQKTLKVYKNGDPNVSFDLKIGSTIKPKDIIDTIESKLKLKSVQKLRLFTVEGLEIPIQDITYIKNGDSLFASSGENFDRSSTLSEYEILKQLGEGGFGEVVLAIHKRSREKVAIKFLKSSARVMANEVDKMFAEAETLKNLRHKNIVKVINCFSLSTSQVAFVMEYLDGGELLEYVLQRGKLTEEQAKDFFKQIAEAIAYCHRNKLIHCDLKLENILLESKDSTVVKVVDFGISGLCTNVQTDASSGSLDYMAPEFFNGNMKSVHPGVDVWALGCMLYGMLTGKLPFSHGSDNKIIERICNAEYEYDEDSKQLSREARHLISRMLEVDPEHRMNIYDVTDHVWLNDKKLPDEIIVEERKNDAPKKPILKSNSSHTHTEKKPTISLSKSHSGSSIKAGVTTGNTPKKSAFTGTSDKPVGRSSANPVLSEAKKVETSKYKK